MVAANEMFDDVGYDAAKTGDIAARANVAQATLFRHFETKADLALFHLRREVDRLVAAVVGRPGDESPYQAVLAVMGDPVVLAALTSPAVQMEGERIARHPELAAHVYWMISDVRQQLAVDFAERLGIGDAQRSRLCARQRRGRHRDVHDGGVLRSGAGSRRHLSRGPRRVATAPRRSPSAPVPDADALSDGTLSKVRQGEGSPPDPEPGLAERCRSTSPKRVTAGNLLALDELRPLLDASPSAPVPDADALSDGDAFGPQPPSLIDFVAGHETP